MPEIARLRPAGVDRRLLKCSYLEQGLLRLCCKTCHAEHQVENNLSMQKIEPEQALVFQGQVGLQTTVLIA